LDDVTLLEKGEASTGPLIVIKEVLVEDDADMMTNKNEERMDVDDNDQDEDSGTRAVCEYGVTIVDAVTGVVTLGQFADDVLRSRMQTLLARFGPSEVSEEYILSRGLYLRIVLHSP
jgi:DNA mismatch repair protein MSH6